MIPVCRWQRMVAVAGILLAMGLLFVENGHAQVSSSKVEKGVLKPTEKKKKAQKANRKPTEKKKGKVEKGVLKSGEKKIGKVEKGVLKSTEKKGKKPTNRPATAETAAQKKSRVFFKEAEKARKAGRFAEAGQKSEAALALAQQAFGQRHRETARFMVASGLALQGLGQYTRAEPLFRKALEIQTAKFGPHHVELAPTLNNLGSLYLDTGRHDLAEEQFQRCLKILKVLRGPRHPDVAATYANLGLVYQATERKEKAESYFRRSLKIREAQLGKDHPDAAQSLTYLAILYEEQQRFPEAEALYRQGLLIREAQLGKDHPDTAHSLANLASLLSITGKHWDAEPLFERALKIRRARLGAEHPAVIRALYNLATLQMANDRPIEAARQVDAARRADRRHVIRTLAGLSDSDREIFLAGSEQADFHIALSLGLRMKDEPDLTRWASSWLLNGKGVGQEIVAASVQLQQAMETPAVAKQARELREIRQQLASLTLIDPHPGQEAARARQIADLTTRENGLTRQVRQVVDSDSTDIPWIESEELRNHLAPGSVFIDLARFQDLDARTNSWKAPRYAAWITPAEGEVAVVDLGPAEAIDNAVTAARTALLAAPKVIGMLGEVDAEKQLKAPLEILARLVLHPLAAKAGKARTWIVSPDAGLWLVPLATLPMPDGAYAIEQMTIRYVVSGRDLVLPAAKPPGAVGRALVMADPDFDLGQQMKSRKPGLFRGTDGSRGLKLGSIPRLPGTEAEAAAVAPKLAELTGREPQVLTGAQALEGAFKAAQNPRVLVLSTHGFYLPQATSEVVEGKKIGAKANAARMTNPLLRCGLLLAGCNFPPESGPSEDGVLTGLEVVGADLRGCELVVLSACETGLGEVRTGEGVAGLRQAFQLAGAQSVVATLWQVPDRQSAQLIASFFDHLAASENRATALRDAQRAMIQARRQKEGAAHPFFWAAFTLTGK